MTTRDEKKSKPLNKMQQQIDNQTNSQVFSSQPPKLKNHNQEINTKLDYLIDNQIPQSDMVTEEELKKHEEKSQKRHQELSQKLADQNSKMNQTINNATQIAYNDGLGKRVDTLQQQTEGMALELDYREQKMDDKTQQYIAKMVDMTQVAQYLDRYTKSINNALVPTLRQLIVQVRQGITHHTNEVTKNVYNEMQEVTGTSMKQLIEQETYKQLQKNTNEVQQAKLSAQLAATVAKNAVEELSTLLSSFKLYLTILLLEFLLIVPLTLVTSGKWKIITMLLLLVIFGLVDYQYLKRGD